jgi:hypothetical protein
MTDEPFSSIRIVREYSTTHFPTQNKHNASDWNCFDNKGIFFGEKTFLLGTSREINMKFSVKL